jgi:hypothetical protein
LAPKIRFKNDNIVNLLDTYLFDFDHYVLL